MRHFEIKVQLCPRQTYAKVTNDSALFSEKMELFTTLSAGGNLAIFGKLMEKLRPIRISIFVRLRHGRKTFVVQTFWQRFRLYFYNERKLLICLIDKK